MPSFRHEKRCTEAGAVRIAGIDLRDVSMASLRRSLVMVPQEPFLYDTTIADNVRFGRPSSRASSRFSCSASRSLERSDAS